MREADWTAAGGGGARANGPSALPPGFVALVSRRQRCFLAPQQSCSFAKYFYCSVKLDVCDADKWISGFPTLQDRT